MLPSGGPTRLLEQAAAGRAVAAADVFPPIYERLHRLAAVRFAHAGRSGFQTAELVHEVYIRLALRYPGGWSGERHLYFSALRAMHDVLVEEARKLGARKRGGRHGGRGRRVARLEDGNGPGRWDDALAVDLALEKLGRADPQGRALVFLRYYCGHSLPEISRLLDVPLRTLERRWQVLRSWLASELGG